MLDVGCWYANSFKDRTQFNILKFQQSYVTASYINIVFYSIDNSNLNSVEFAAVHWNGKWILVLTASLILSFYFVCVYPFQFFVNFSALMEMQPIKMSHSPTLSNSVVVSPETLSHHSSPAKTSRIYYQPTHLHIQHQTIDETINSKIPLSISTHQQLTSAALGTPVDHAHSSISAFSGIHSDVSSDSILINLILKFAFFSCNFSSFDNFII